MNRVLLDIGIFKRVDGDQGYIYQGFLYTDGSREWWDIHRLGKTEEEKQDEKDIDEAIEKLNLPENGN